MVYELLYSEKKKERKERKKNEFEKANLCSRGHYFNRRPQFTVLIIIINLGGLGVTRSPRDSRFAGSNPAEVDGFFQDVSWGPESEI